jgi:hypothetical protein
MFHRTIESADEYYSLNTRHYWMSLTLWRLRFYLCISNRRIWGTGLRKLSMSGDMFPNGARALGWSCHYLTTYVSLANRLTG